MVEIIHIKLQKIVNWQRETVYIKYTAEHNGDGKGPRERNVQERKNIDQRCKNN